MLSRNLFMLTVSVWVFAVLTACGVVTEQKPVPAETGEPNASAGQLAITAPAAGQVVGDQLRVKVAKPLPNGKIAETISLNVDGKDLGTQSAVIEADGSAVAQFAAAALSEGPHTCEIAAKAGTSQVNATRTIVIDHTAPVVKIKSPLAGLFTGWVAIEVASTDLHLASVTGKMGTKVLGSVKAVSNWATMLKLPQQFGGAAELVLEATDKAGNVGKAAVSLTILAPPAFLQAETPFAGADGEGTPPAPTNPANTNLTAAMTDGHAADMDGDGSTDILVATSTGITICYGTGKGMLIETPVYAGEPASWVRALDTETVPVTGFEPATTHSGRLALARLTASSKSSLALFVAVGRKLALVHKLPLETEIGHTLVLPSSDGKLTVVAAATNKEAPTLLVGTLQAPADLQWSGGSAKSINGQPLLSGLKKLAGVADVVHMRAGDVTGDGHADLIFGRSGPSVVTVCLNDGAQGFATCKDTLIAGETKPIDAIAVKTKNSQGADLLVAGQTTSSLFYLKNDGKGNFSVIGRVALANPPISLDVMAATVGGGGGAQAVVSSDACSVQMIDLELLAQGGVLDLTLACRAGYVTAGTPSFVVGGDFNGDGVSDMFVANGGTAGADMMMSNGAGLSATLDFPLCIRDKAQTGTVPTALAVADFEQDGKPDLIVAGSVTYSMVQKCGGTEDSPVPDFASPLLMYRDAGFGSHKLPAYTEYSPHADGVSTATTACGGSVKAIKAMLPTDADGDGRPDLAVILEGNYALTVGAGDPACGFNETHEVDSHFGMAYAPPCAIESAIEPKGPNQGAPYSRTTAAIFRNHPTKGLGFPATAAAVGKPPPPWFTFAAGLAPLALTVGDVDSDGKPDLVTLLGQVGDGSQKDFLPPRARVFRNTGTGFAPIPQVGEFTITPPGSSKLVTYKGTWLPAALQPVDIRLAATALQVGASLHILNNGSQNVSTYAANAKGTYASPAKLHAVSGTPRAFAVADVNHDGAQDVVAAVDGWLWVGRGLPDGNIETVEVTAVEKGQLSAVAVGDFNGDTHPDIAFAYKALNRVSLALGDGTGKFLVYPAQFYVNKEPVQIEAVDANGDGIDDLFVRCLTGRSVSALLSKKLP